MSEEWKRKVLSGLMAKPRIIHSGRRLSQRYFHQLWKQLRMGLKGEIVEEGADRPDTLRGMSLKYLVMDEKEEKSNDLATD